MLAGPAGAGKTTLARAWLSSVRHPWWWLTVEPPIAESDRFWPLFVRSVQRAAQHPVLDSSDALDQQRLDGRTLAETLALDLAAAEVPDGPIVIAVDEAHLLGPETWRDLEWLIAHQPEALHLVLMSRSDPPFSVARMRTLGWYTDVRADALALSRAEVRSMLRHSPLAAADSDLADAVLERTEGWAAGIRLAMIALERGVAPERILTGQDAAHGMVAELLIAEALQQQPADVRTFLRQTSVARVLDAPLCRALTGRDDSRAVLEQLARDQVFVAGLEGDREQYRYHPLFADVLRGSGRARPRRRARATRPRRVVAGVDR